MKKTLSILLLSSALTLPATASIGGEILIVTAAGNSETSVDERIIKDAFLGKPAHFSNGTEIKAIDRKESTTSVREKFYEEFVQKSLTQMKAYWSQIIFTGRGYPPPVADDLDSLKRTLKSMPGSITYIDASEKDPSLKVLARIQVK